MLGEKKDSGCSGHWGGFTVDRYHCTRGTGLRGSLWGKDLAQSRG